ncbi:MAG: hypothetical protein HYS17_11805 [Micavibrio aeruginosavorus]|uniref:Porin n=1 Tax=Micavibrio aeruginosavorus TaxID=349221 RepID=A0A7T5R236_9BACT|nr:MAG: hypothetical protein HYS17_11805 [Micavibrio aeruginosavorus]
MSRPMLLAAALAGAVTMTSPFAYAASDADIQALRAELQAMKQAYEDKIDRLESRIADMEESKAGQSAMGNQSAAPSGPAAAVPSVGDNSMNPSLGVIFNGRYGNYTESESEIAGFAIGHEGERPDEGLRIDETEMNFKASVDDKFLGSATIAFAEHEGETEVEVEEAYVQTTSLPGGVVARAGRFFVPLGYLNELHAHADDFADRPLPNRVFLDRSYGDDGVGISWVLPTDFYSEIGAGGFRGRGFPAEGGDGGDIGAWNAYARTGGDIGDEISWRLGISTLQTRGIDRAGNEDSVLFEGDSDLYALDGRWVWAPGGNNREREVILQGEYFLRDEDGAYEDVDAGTGFVAYDETQSGWYVQGVYKFDPQWRVGARYSALSSADAPAGLAGSALDDDGHNPWTASGMVDWSNSEFSRLRVQYNREELAGEQEDNQLLIQYIMSIGAHGAHPF